MTDITALAQSEINDAQAQLKQISEHPTPSTQYARVLRKYIATMVEALEKAQQERDNWHNSFDNERFRADKLKAHIDEMTEEQTACINELSRIIQKEVKAKREAKQRIAELESRTVTVKLPQAVSAGGQGYQEKVERILTAAGIKWEAE
ncbi:TPA: hypothetical protein MM085_005220 [Klebsiella pneumoniae]|nr:hypothetical protein [Klebsiella pneumoniae]HBZ8113586.1 hypothetical protein [Klebsiella pneumoniae]